MPTDALDDDAQEQFVLAYGAPPPYGATSPPSVVLVDPPEATPLHPTDAVTFDVTIASGTLVLVAFRVRFVTSGEREAAYDRDDAAGPWDPRYAASSIEAITGGYRLVLRRTGGWPPGRIGILPRAVSSGGVAA